MLAHRWIRIPLRAALALVVLVVWSGAQEPKPGGKWYQDTVDLGFKIKEPQDWGFVPAAPLEPNLIGKYADPGEGKYVNLGKEAFVLVEMVLVKFDRRAKEGEKRQIGGQTVEIVATGAKNIDEWMTGGLDEGHDWHVVGSPKPLKCAVSTLTATYAIYEGKSARGRQETEDAPITAYVASYTLTPDIDVAMVGLGPGGKKWHSFESAYATIAKTLTPLSVTAVAKAPAGVDARSKKRATLEADMAKTPGWTLFETPNYFIISAYDDKQFIEEMKQRLEGIRAVYERDYPPSKARKAKPSDEGDDEEGEDGEGGKKPTPAASGDTPPQDSPEKTVSEPAPVDALESGRCSVVRVCKDHDQYLQYGGPPDTGGYFNPLQAELVIFDDKAVRGREFTWGVLSHEGFHQYIYAFFGNLSPHSWYNEGTGDYYFGYQFKNGKFKEGPAQLRVQDVKDLIKANKYVPLRDFVKWTKSEYYGQNKGNGNGGGTLDGGEAYAQGWSLIWFLRTGAAHAKGWQKPWGSILDKYLNTLIDTGSVKKAVAAAFDGVDWDAFEASWLDYTR